MSEVSLLEVRQSEVFAAWLVGLRDKKARAVVTRRLRRVSLGNVGDSRSVGGGGVNELRIDLGPGYRLYYVRRGERLVLLLCGGDKSSQDRDIAQAQRMAKESS